MEYKVASLVAAAKYKDALEAAEQLQRDATHRFGQDSRCYAVALSEHAAVLQSLNRGIEARTEFERAIALFRQFSVSQDPKFALTLNNYGFNLYWLRNYAAAARAHEEALEARRKRQPIDLSDVASSLHNLADAYRYLQRPPEAVNKLYEEALSIKMSQPKQDELSIAQTRQNLASAQEDLARSQGNPDLLKKAFGNLQEALQIYRRFLKPEDARIAAVLNRQGLLNFRIGNYTEAETKFNESLHLQRATLDTQRATLAATLDDFALNEIELGRYTQAKSLAEEALAIRRAVFPGDHSTIARTLANLSYLAWLTRDIDGALSLSRQATQITLTKAQLDDGGKLRLQRHLLMLWSKATSSNSQTTLSSIAEEGFSIGQQAIGSGTAQTVARTALRFSAHEPRLRELLKEVDDLDRSSGILEQSLTHTLTLAHEPASDRFSQVRADLGAVAERRKVVLGEIEKSFPNYSKLIDPKPVSSKAVRELLRPKEALVAFLSGFEDVYVWCITRDGISWRKLDLAPQQLRKHVETLRAGLNLEPTAESLEPLFNVELANALYNQLIGPISKDLKLIDKILVVPSGPLIGLPLQALVSSKPKIPTPTRSQPLAYKGVDFLIKRFAISIVPSVESLERLRHRAIPSSSRKPLIGFANPLPSPDFSPPNERGVATVLSGWNREARVNRGFSPKAGESHDVPGLRKYLADNPLENSAAELEEIGSVLGADPSDLYIGTRATETELKKQNKEGKLSSYGVIYFATHGYIAGWRNESEPFLALTVPLQPSEFDDGFLTASEIAELNLDADWVVLSACDTASGDGKGAEGLSGLARAFFHAGARALLVSNWSLDDISAREIMKATFEKLKQDGSAQKTKALRTAMLSQISGARPGERVWDAYPGRWAAFEVVGVD